MENTLQSSTAIKARIVHTNRIVHNDLELGPGKVTQRRSINNETEEKQIELCWIFRDIADIKFLDTERYTRVCLHTEGPLKEYRYDAFNELTPDDDLVIKPYANNHMGRWLLVEYVDKEARRLLAELTELVHASSKADI